MPRLPGFWTPGSDVDIGMNFAEMSDEFRISRAGPGHNPIERLPETHLRFRQGIVRVQAMEGQRGKRDKALCIARYNRRKMVEITRERDSGRRASIPNQRNGGEGENDVSQPARMEDEDLHYSIIIVF